MALKRGIEQAVDTVVEELKHLFKATKDKTSFKVGTASQIRISMVPKSKWGRMSQ